MSALQTLSSASTLDPPIPQPARRSLLRAVRHSPQQTQPLTLDQQGIRAEWFSRGINESNCALFHASLYPILPKLRDRIQSWLKSNSADPLMADDQMIVSNFASDLIVLAFEKRRQWRRDRPVVEWLVSFIPAAYAESDPL